MAMAMAKQRPTYPVSQRAAIMRINRRLESDGKRLRLTRGLLAENRLGKYYVVNSTIDSIVEKNVDLTELGRRLGVFETWEEVADE